MRIQAAFTAGSIGSQARASSTARSPLRKAMQCFPSAERNRGPIWDVLRPLLPDKGLVLEIASGTGQHVAHFASQSSPELRWQPSELDEPLLHSIRAYITEHSLRNVEQPMALDVTKEPWPVADASVDVIVNVNMIHISPWTATQALMRQAGRVLRPGGTLYMYGPYKVDGRCTTDSNAEFDRSLQSRNPEWGLRDVADVRALASAAGLEFQRMVDMPANNFSVIYRRAGSGES